MSNKRTPNATSYRKTCRRYNDPGHAHAFTFSCFRRQPFLSRDRSRQWLIDAIDRARKKHGFHVWAYVIMPEHSHLLIYPTKEDYDISAILASIKKSVANRALAYVERHTTDFLTRMRDEQPSGKAVHRFWQRGGGYDRNLWSPRYIWQTIDYIHDNPVRRRLCDTPADWYWSSAADYRRGTSGPLVVEMSDLPNDPRRSGY